MEQTHTEFSFDPSHEEKLEFDMLINRHLVWFAKAAITDPGRLTALENKLAQQEAIYNRPRTIAEAQDMTGFTDSTIRDAINRGELPATRKGRKILLMAADLKAWQLKVLQLPRSTASS